MLRLPARIEARLADVQGHALRASDILIAPNILVDGRYYYGNLVGLTTRDGVASMGATSWTSALHRIERATQWATRSPSTTATRSLK